MLKSRCRSAARRMLSPVTGSTSTIWVDSPLLKISGLELVDQTFESWNPLTSWLRRLEELRAAA